MLAKFLGILMQGTQILHHTVAKVHACTLAKSVDAVHWIQHGVAKCSRGLPETLPQRHQKEEAFCIEKNGRW